MDMCCLSEWMLTPPFLPAACCHDDVVRRAGAITPWALPAVVFLFFFFFFFRYSLLFSFVVAVSRATICHHLSINTCCTHILTVLELQECSVFFPLIHFILLPLHIALVLSPAEESQVSHYSPLWCPSFSLVVLVLTNKSKGKAHFALYILSFSFSGAFMCINVHPLNLITLHISSSFLWLYRTSWSRRIVPMEQSGAKRCYVGC